MRVRASTSIEDLAEWNRRVVFYNDGLPQYVEIKLNNHGDSIDVDSASEADELISWATAARDYLRQEPPAAPVIPISRLPEDQPRLCAYCHHPLSVHQGGCTFYGCGCTVMGPGSIGTPQDEDQS